jgi:hypothetical protein
VSGSVTDDAALIGSSAGFIMLWEAMEIGWTVVVVTPETSICCFGITTAALFFDGWSTTGFVSLGEPLRVFHQNMPPATSVPPTNTTNKAAITPFFAGVNRLAPLSATGVVVGVRVGIGVEDDVGVSEGLTVTDDVIVRVTVAVIVTERVGEAVGDRVGDTDAVTASTGAGAWKHNADTRKTAKIGCIWR